jgi:hypothetical protein
MKALALVGAKGYAKVFIIEFGNYLMNQNWNNQYTQ